MHDETCIALSMNLRDLLVFHFALVMLYYICFELEVLTLVYNSAFE